MARRSPSAPIMDMKIVANVCLEAKGDKYQEPLGSDLGMPSKTELPEALHMLDLADGRFGDALASAVEMPPVFGQELALQRRRELHNRRCGSGDSGGQLWHQCFTTRTLVFSSR